MSTEIPPVGNRLGSLGASKPLGSLVQSARGKQLNQVRGFFIVIGLIMTVYYGSELAKIRKLNQGAVQVDLQKNRGQVDEQPTLETLIGVATALYVSMMFVGVVFVVIGLVLRKFPVAATLIGLILYIAESGLQLFLGGLPAILAGSVFTVLIIVGLIKSLQTAIALQHDDRKAAELASPLS